jgi:hypothetical protein
VDGALRRFNGWSLRVPVTFIFPSQQEHLLEAQLVSEFDICPDLRHSRPFNAAVEHRKLCTIVEQRRSPSLGEVDGEQTEILGKIIISPKRRLASINKTALQLTETEFKCLYLLVKNYDSEYVGYMDFAQYALGWPLAGKWEEIAELDKRSILTTMRVHKRNLEKKLAEYKRWVSIEPKHGKGYRLVHPGDNTEIVAQQSLAQLRLDPSSDAQYGELTQEGAALLLLDAGAHKLILGRNQLQCDLVIPHRRVSGTHAQLYRMQDDRWCICDLGTEGKGSAHGTYLHFQGKRLRVGVGEGAGKVLTHGDLIEFAPDLYYRFEEAPEIP